MRAFLAISLLPEEECKLRLLQESLASLPALSEFRWTLPQNIHLTLRFFGEIEDAQAAQAAQALETIARDSHPFELLLDRLGVFPHLRNPNVLWVGPEQSPPPLETFVERLFEGLKAANFPSEDRPFRAHLTIARRRVKGRPPAGLEGELDAAERRWLSPPLRLWMKEAGIFRSDLRPNGAIHTPVHRSRFS